jgi:hypothetical protein
MPGTIADVGRTLTNFRLTDEARSLLALVARRRGISQAAVVEQAIRDYAESHGIRLSAPSVMEVADDPDNPKLYNPDG